MYEKEGELGVETVHAGFAAFLDIKTVLDFSYISCRRNHSIAIKRYYPYHLSW